MCCTRPSSAANQPHVTAAVDRRDRQTEGHLTVTQTLHWVLSFLSFIDDIDMFVDFICIS